MRFHSRQRLPISDTAYVVAGLGPAALPTPIEKAAVNVCL
jgi:hypothetical protein